MLDNVIFSRMLECIKLRKVLIRALTRAVLFV